MSPAFHRARRSARSAASVASFAAAITLTLALAGAAAAADHTPAAPSSPEPRPALTGDSDMQMTLAAITGWVAADMGLPVPVELPRLFFVDPARMAAALTEERQRYRDERFHLQQGSADVLAFYNMRTRSLYLPEGWSGATPTELSILVHEVVHHLQAVHDQRFACPAAREKQAFATQQRWLEMFGKDLETAIGIDRLTLLVATSCMF